MYAVSYVVLWCNVLFFVFRLLCLLCWWCSNFWGAVFVGLSFFGRDGFWWFFGLGFCWFLCFWMLWAVVFILGRWLVWRFGFYRVFGFLRSFASLYRFNFANFDSFCWLVCCSARNICDPYFLFFEGSWMVCASELLLYCFFIICLFFCDFLLQLHLIFVL